MTLNCFIAHDFGTSGVKSILIDQTGKIIADTIETYPMQMPKPGWVEQRPEDYWNAVTLATRNLIAESQVDVNAIKGIVFSTQAMGIIPIDKDGNVLHPNISWVDGRAEDEARQLMNKFLGKKVFKAIVGIEITGKDVLPKLVWIKNKLPDVYQKTDKFLDVNGYLKFKCTGKKVAEWSGACSYAFDIKKKDWERIFFKIAGVDINKLPDLIRSVDSVGGLTASAAREMNLVEGIPVYGGCDDTQSAAIGSGAIGEGEGHIYLGTAAQLTFTTKRTPKFKNGAVALQSADPNMNIVVGVTEAAGVNIEWLLNSLYATEKENLSTKDLFELFENEMRAIAPGADHLLFTPWFLGERCPVSTTLTRSTMFNLSHEHTRGHMARALCEGIAYNIRWKLQNMEKDFGFHQNALRVIGGGSNNKLWLQILADVTQREIITTNQPRHAGAIGAAMCAMVGSKTYPGFESIHNLISAEQKYLPNPDNFTIYNQQFELYINIYKALKPVYAKANRTRFSIS
ncbi:MAG: FGGY-family carbohydrate kinase [Chitinophagales bacterium]